MVEKRKTSYKSLIFFLAVLCFFGQSSWGGKDCDVSVSLYSPPSDSAETSDRWLDWDKLEHLGVSAFLSGVSYSLLHEFYNNNQESSVYFSVSFTLSAGLGKEFYDSKTPGGTFSYKDLIADVVGIGLGLFLATR
jgi:putative lipoprotein